MNQDPSQTDERLSQIVAYLDGESDDEKAAEIEKAMTRDPGIRHEIESLQRAWDMLDFLPMPPTTADFSRRTAQMATQSLSNLPAPRRRTWLWTLLWLTGLGAAFAIGIGAAVARTAPEERLTQDAYFLERLDLYRAVSESAFLDRLQSEALVEQFDEFVDPSASSANGPRGDVLAKAAVEEEPKAAALERNELLNRQRQFGELPLEQQQSLLDLHSALRAADKPQYASILERYRAWLDTLTQTDRSRIEAALSTEDRIAVVREILDAQAKALAADLAPLERDRRDNRRGPRTFGRPPEEYMAAYRALQPKLTDVERERLNRSSFRSRFSLVLVLSAKYDVPVPASFKEFTSFIFEMLYPTVHDPMTRFGAASYSALSEDDKKRFIAAAADILLLPDVDRRTRYDFLNSQPEHVAAAIEQLTRRNPPAEQTLVNILYYKQNPDAAPAELRASLDVFDPITMLENIHRQPSPPSPDRPSIDNPPPPPDRRRPPPPSGRPQDLGGPPSPRRER